MNLKKLVLLVMVVMGSASLFAFDREDCREIIENGEEKVLEGVLSSKDGNTYLTVGKDKYEVLRGPGMFSYKDGAKVELEGLVYEMQIMPVKVIIDGVEISVGPERGFGRGCRNFDDNENRPNKDRSNKGFGPKGR